MPDLPPFEVHLPDAPEEFFQKKVIKGKKVFIAKCGMPAKMPPRISLEHASDDRVYLKAGPHKRYYHYCAKCAAHVEAEGVELHNVAGRDSMGQPA